MNDLEIFSFVELRSTTDFVKWKKNRKKHFEFLRLRLIFFSDTQLKELFLNWEKAIRSYTANNNPNRILSLLMAIFLSCHYRSDITHIKYMISIVYSFLNSPEVAVVKSATQTIQWITKETRNVADFFREPMKLAFSWLADKFTQLNFNSLYIISKGKKYAVNEVVHHLHTNFDLIFFLYYL